MNPKSAQIAADRPRPVNEFEIENGRWRPDPERSMIAFRVPWFYGLRTVTGRFERYEGTMDLHREPAIELSIEAASLNTGNARRDEHLRSADFFDVQRAPVVHFRSEDAILDGERLRIRGSLEAAGNSIQLQFEASLRRHGNELAMRARMLLDQRLLGMGWTPLGLVPSPSELIVDAVLLHDRD